MITHENCQSIVKDIASKLPVDQYEIMISGQEESLTRFANSMIHQNVKSESSRIQLRVIKNNQIGVSSCDNLTEDGIDFVIRNAMDLCFMSKPDTEFVSLPSPSVSQYPEPVFFDHSRDFDSPDYRANTVSKVCQRAKNKSVNAFGKFESNRNRLFIANSLGIDQYQETTNCNFSSQIMDGFSSGFAQTSGRKLTDLSIERVIEESLETCLQSKTLDSLEPSEYEVILKPEATSGILGMLSYMGFSTQAIQEGRSYLSNRLNDTVFSELLSIQDNFRHKNQLMNVFDFEGSAKHPVQLIKNGKFSDFVTDSKWAMKLNKPNTGHALPAPNAYGPFPLHLVMEGGIGGDWRGMVKNAEKAILITRFWYTNPLNPKKGVCTGLTRDGTFLVLNGKIAKAIRNFRFTDNLISVFNSILHVGSDTRLCGDDVSPSLHCQSLRFVSQAEPG